MKKKKGMTLDEVGEMLGFVIEHMATKDDIAKIWETMATKNDVARLEERMMGRIVNIEQELRIVRSDFSGLSEKVENVIGYRKEIDHVLERVVVLEKHSGLDKKLARD